ncbi:MAG: phosphatidylinositol mannoside acyltransferase [Actinomycetales bacterium]|nr:phosphatidylinositol mannoside acyltransferase [Actinomycetales bacterium]
MSGTAFARVWRLAQRAPAWFVRAACAVAAFVAWVARLGGVRQLEENLRRVRPDLDPRGLRRLSRAGMASYLRYYAEIFEVHKLTPDQLTARVRPEGHEAVQEYFEQGRSVVLALTHMGNWDLAGAWASRELAPVTSVAEVLEPRELFEEFVALREGIGIAVVPLERGADVFRQLVRIVRGGGQLVPLLADRDLTARGAEVDLFGERSSVAVGPAALGIATGTPVVPTGIFYERLHGARRRAAGSRWGIVLRFHPAVELPADVAKEDRVRHVTQAWVDAVAGDIAAHPQDWHMLQKVFVADLDPERYVRATTSGEAR